ncbi:hypothetical protein AB0L40_04180 [Patulibacter sp. NPDC049589]|uniref:hypothetical protein n=1 Tax=Patulibacter sp. NPDC049589 TaxID=3154731 RepID=UPI003440FC99
MPSVPKNDVTRYWWHGGEPLWTGVAALVGVFIAVGIALALDLSDAAGGVVAIATVVVVQVAVLRVRERRRARAAPGPSTPTDRRASAARPRPVVREDPSVSAPTTAVVILRPASDATKAELTGSLSTWAQRHRRFADLPAALTWARAKADAVALHVDGAWWSAGTVPPDDERARPLDPATEARLADSVAEEFRRSAAERRRYPEPVRWYLAFALPETIELPVAVAALEDCPDVVGLTVREPAEGRPHLFAHVEARSRDDVLRTKHEPISAALRAVAPPIRRPAVDHALVDLSIIGSHQIGLVEFEHRAP